jgi:hypothetical protein
MEMKIVLNLKLSDNRKQSEGIFIFTYPTKHSNAKKMSWHKKKHWLLTFVASSTYRKNL